MIIEFDIATPSLNKMVGRWVGSNWKKKFLSRLQGYELIKSKKCRKQLKIQRFGSRILDEDNYHGGCKKMIDAIKEKGLIVDDRPEWCEIIFLPQCKCSRIYEKTIVEIKDIK